MQYMTNKVKRARKSFYQVCLHTITLTVLFGSDGILSILYCQFAFSMVEWLKRHDCYQHDLDSKPDYTILLCPWK